MDIQLLLVFILAILTVSLVGVSVYIIMILKELRHTLTKVNKVIDNAEHMGSFVSSPVATIAGLVTTIADTIKTVKSVRSIADFSEDD